MKVIFFLHWNLNLKLVKGLFIILALFCLILSVFFLCNTNKPSEQDNCCMLCTAWASSSSECQQISHANPASMHLAHVVPHLQQWSYMWRWATFQHSTIFHCDCQALVSRVWTPWHLRRWSPSPSSSATCPCCLSTGVSSCVAPVALAKPTWPRNWRSILCWGTPQITVMKGMSVNWQCACWIVHIALPLCPSAHSFSFLSKCTQLYLFVQMHIALPVCPGAYSFTSLSKCA